MTDNTQRNHRSESTAQAASGNPAAGDLARVEALLAEIDLDDSHSLMFFGSGSQNRLTEVSDAILEQVRTKELGASGEALNDMVLTLRGFEPRATDAAPGGWFARLLGRGRDAAGMLQRYEKVRDQVDAVSARLQRHQTQLMLDVEMLDRLYAANLDHFDELEAYIAAGERKLQEVDGQTLPQHEAALREGEGHLLGAQALRDLRSMRDALERRLQDLRMTRQVAMQALPSIRLVQENDKALVAKIESMLVNTVPLWRQQLAQAVTIQRGREAAAAVTAAADLTNDLLRANAENLRQANAETRRQAERGVFDVEAIAEANQTLIATIEDSLRIADEGRAARAEAGAELDRLEQQLRDSLAAASQRELQISAGGRQAPAQADVQSRN